MVAFAEVAFIGESICIVKCREKQQKLCVEEAVIFKAKIENPSQHVIYISLFLYLKSLKKKTTYNCI